MEESKLDEQVVGARAYEDLHVPALFKQWCPQVLDAAGVGSGKRVLDVACGTGVLAREAQAKHNHRHPLINTNIITKKLSPRE